MSARDAISDLQGIRSPSARDGAGRWLRPFSLGVAVLLLSTGITVLLCGRGELPMPPTVNGGTATPADPTVRGRLVYQVHCATCHGAEGHGDGSAAAELKPAPRDFASSAWKFGASTAAIHRVVADGMRGTGMPAYRHALSAADLDAVIAFVQTLAPAGAGPDPFPELLATLLKGAGFTPADALRPATPFEVRDAAGTKHSLEKLCGRPVLLAFWGVDCPHCLKKFPELERLATEFADKGLVVLPICADESDAADAAAIARRHAARLTVFADPSALAARRFDVQVLPTTVLIDAQGRLLGRAEGVVDWSAAEVSTLLDHVLVRGMRD